MHDEDEDVKPSFGGAVDGHAPAAREHGEPGRRNDHGSGNDSDSGYAPVSGADGAGNGGGYDSASSANNASANPGQYVGDGGLLVIDKSKIPRPYKCPFPNCDKDFYRLEQ